MLRRRTRSRTARRDTERPVPTLVGGLLVSAGLVALAVLGLSLYNSVPGRDYQTVYVSVPQIGNLLSHDQVRSRGVRIGQVSGREVGPDGRPLVALQIEPGTELRADTTVRIRGNGLLGARFVELVDGRSQEPLRDGATVRGSTDAYAFGLPEALETFDEDTRGRLGDTLGGLGQGFVGNGLRANDALRKASERTTPFSQIAREVLRREGSARRLLPALESAVKPLDENRAALTELSGVAADAVDPFVTEREAVRSTLSTAPPTLAALDPGLVGGTRLVRSVERLATAADRTLPPAPAALRSTRALLADAREPLKRTAALLDAAEPAVPGLLKVTTALQPVLKPVSELIKELRPTLGEVERFGCDIVNFGVTVRSMTGFQQPGPDGPVGPPQAFRLIAALPVTTDALGVKDPVSLLDRRTLKPCEFLAKPYPQFVPGSSKAGR